MDRIEVKSNDLELLRQNFIELDVDSNELHEYFNYGLYQVRDEGLFEKGIINVSDYFEHMANYLASTTNDIKNYGDSLCQIDYSYSNKYEDLEVPKIGTCNKKALYNLIGEEEKTVPTPVPIEVPEEDLPVVEEEPLVIEEEPPMDETPEPVMEEEVPAGDDEVPVEDVLTEDQAEDALSELLEKQLAEEQTTSIEDADSVQEAVSIIAKDSFDSISMDETPTVVPSDNTPVMVQDNNVPVMVQDNDVPISNDVPVMDQDVVVGGD